MVQKEYTTNRKYRPLAREQRLRQNNGILDTMQSNIQERTPHGF